MTLPTDPFRLAGLREAGVDSPLAELHTVTDPGFLESFNHGDLPKWLATLDQLPDLRPSGIDLRDAVRVGTPADADGELAHLEALLRKFIPWRKGPFNLFGIQVDSEWRSDMKWERLLPHLDPLAGRRVLDVGCGNGYHCWRAVGEDAGLVVGVEPYLLYVMQFLAVRNYLADLPCYLLPLRLEHYPGPFHYWNTVFSMGVLYHVRAPVDHLLLLKKCLAPGGQLVLETLVVEGEEGYCLTPADRYARMSNVWFVPTPASLERWLQRCGFTDIRLVDINVTTVEEQRSTSWMPFQSLADSLDPADASMTCEGLPAPRRAIVIARNRS